MSGVSFFAVTGPLPTEGSMGAPSTDAAAGAMTSSEVAEARADFRGLLALFAAAVGGEAVATSAGDGRPQGESLASSDGDGTPRGDGVASSERVDSAPDGGSAETPDGGLPALRSASPGNPTASPGQATDSPGPKSEAAEHGNPSEGVTGPDPKPEHRRTAGTDEAEASSRRAVPVGWTRALGMPRSAEASEPRRDAISMSVDPAARAGEDPAAPAAGAGRSAPRADGGATRPDAPQRPPTSDAVANQAAFDASAEGMRHQAASDAPQRPPASEAATTQAAFDASAEGMRHQAASDAVREGVTEADDRSARPSTTLPAGAAPASPVDVPSAAAPEIPSDEARRAVERVAADPRLEELTPELRRRVLRVVERMAVEHGHSVRLVEGYRTPDRQRALFAQGRTEPGPVVTWTTRSLHSEGRAVDLQVDGTWKAPEAYAHLQRIAKEEGLGTLGMRDPGHLEWRGPAAEAGSSAGSSGSREVQGDRRAVEAPLGQPLERGPQVARPARVARVASAARVAAPAEVARPGSPSGIGSRHDHGEPRIPAAPPPVPTPRLEGGSGAAPDGSRVAAHETSGKEQASRKAAVDGDVAASTLGGGSRPDGPAGAVSGVRATVPADPMRGVDRVLQAREALEAMSPSRVSVRLDGTAGPVEQVRVSLADRALDAAMSVRDPAAARGLRQGMDELVRALEAKGFDPGSLTVQAAGATEAVREGLLNGRTDMSAGLLRTFVDAVAAQASARGSGTDTGSQEPWSQERRPEHDGAGRGRRDESRRERK